MTDCRFIEETFPRQIVLALHNAGFRPGDPLVTHKSCGRRESCNVVGDITGKRELVLDLSK